MLCIVRLAGALLPGVGGAGKSPAPRCRALAAAVR